MASFSSLVPPTSRINFENLHYSLTPCSPHCCNYTCNKKPTSLAAPTSHSLHIGFEFSVGKPRKKDNILQTLAVRQLTGSLTSAEGLRFAIVVARFNEIVTKPLLEGALNTFKQYSVKEEDIDVVWVPGSFEIGVVAEKLGKSQKYQAIVCIGAVIRGDTSHYDAVVNSATSGVLSAGLNSDVPDRNYSVHLESENPKVFQINS